jgi:hypothetical protein
VIPSRPFSICRDRRPGPQGFYPPEIRTRQQEYCIPLAGRCPHRLGFASPAS